MSLLDKLKSLLGLDDANEERRQDVGVTVERNVGESDQGAAADGHDEDADDAGGDIEKEPDDAVEDSETDVDDTDTSVDEATLIDEAEPDVDDETDEPGDEPDVDDETDEPGDEPDEDEDEEPGDEPDEDEDDGSDGTEAESTRAQTAGDLEDIKGIGPAYAERLADVGIESIGDLAAADPAEIAADTDLSESRVENWVEQAKVR